MGLFCNYIADICGKLLSLVTQPVLYFGMGSMYYIKKTLDQRKRIPKGNIHQYLQLHGLCTKHGLHWAEHM